MPFTRISLNAGKDQDYLSAISDGLYQALIDHFEVPENDLFVAIHQHQPGELIFDRSYGGGPRSDDFILFHISTGRARSPKVKARFYEGLVSRLSMAPGVRPEDVMVVIADSAYEDWSFASGMPAASPLKQGSET